MNTYQAYLEHEAGNIIKMEEALKIYTDMVNCVRKCKLEDKEEIWKDFINSAIEYAYIRSQWEYMSKSEKMDADEGRTLKHNSVITHVNMLSKMAENDGVDNSWKEKLGDNRKRIGDFACFVSYITGISNR